MRMHPSKVAGLACLILSGCGTSAALVQTDRDLRVSDVALASGADSAALQIAEGVVAHHPDNPDALVRLGNAQSALGEHDAAEASFRRAIASDDGSSAARFGLARLHLQSDPATARSELGALASALPHDPKVLTDLGVAEDMLADHEAAQGHYRQALAVSPGSTCAEVDLGLSLALSGKSNQALAILGPFAEAADTPPKVRQDYALAVVLAGRTEDARMILGQDLPSEQVALAVDAFRELQTATR